MGYLALPSIDGAHMDGNVINVQLHLASKELRYNISIIFEMVGILVP